MNTQLISRLSPIADSYDFYIIDLWGTLHNGIEPFPEALDCLKKLKKAGKSIALLSNAPFRVEVVVKVITQIGVPDDLYDNVLSSGEVAWNAIADRSNNSFKSLGKRVVFIGNERHRSMLENPNIEEVKSIKYADFILCTGPRKKSDTIKDYFSELSEAANLSLPMVCANPDREVMRGQQKIGIFNFQSQSSRSKIDLIFPKIIFLYEYENSRTTSIKDIYYFTLFSKNIPYFCWCFTLLFCRILKIHLITIDRNAKS